MSKYHEFRLRPHQLVLFILVLVLPNSAPAQSSLGAEGPSPSRVDSIVTGLRARIVNPEQISEARKTGFDLLRLARYQEAWNLFSAALVVAPNDARLMYGGALALFNQQRIADAEPLARAAVGASVRAREGLESREADADVADALVLLGVVLAVKGDNASALEMVSQAATIAPENFDAQFALGRARYGAGNPTGAAASFRTALALRPDDAKAGFFLATALESASDYEGALAAYRRLLDLHPRSADAHLGLGALLIKLGNANTQDGIAELKRAIALNEDLYEAQITLGRALIRVG